MAKRSGAPRESTPHAAVFGAGPAGLAAAEVMSAAGLTVSVFDRMPSVGRKFLMAGRGGLNLTHSEPLGDFLTRYAHLPDPVRHAIENYPPDAVVAWAEGLGEQTFIGSSGRIFPMAMKASPLLRAWLTRLTAQGVTFRMQHAWQGCDARGQPLVSDHGASPALFDCDASVLAMGGASWPRLGANGAWTTTFADLGIPYTPLKPANAGLTLDWSAHFQDRFAGQPLKRIGLTIAGTTHRGEAVITRSGLEGGVVYGVSSWVASRVAQSGPLAISIDLKPEETHEMLSRRLRRERGKDSVATWLRKCLKLPPAAIGLLREAHRTLPASPDDLARLIKALPLTVTGTAGLERAISTSGGVALEALDQNFMVRTRPGIFLAGEMLDWDAPTGGYLLQACFATGRAAGHGVLAYLAHMGGRAAAASEQGSDM